MRFKLFLRDHLVEDISRIDISMPDRSDLESQWQSSKGWQLPGFSPYPNTIVARDQSGNMIGYVTWMISRQGSLNFDIDTREKSPDLGLKLITAFLNKVDRGSVKRIVASAHTPEGKRLILALSKRWGIPWEGADHT